MNSENQLIKDQCEKLHFSRVRLIKTLMPPEVPFPRSKFMQFVMNKGTQHLFTSLAQRMLTTRNVTILRTGWSLARTGLAWLRSSTTNG